MTIHLNSCYSGRMKIVFALILMAFTIGLITKAFAAGLTFLGIGLIGLLLYLLVKLFK